MNRFQCSKCKRILDKEGNKSFKCSACGHGTMVSIKPRAYCEICKAPAYANIDSCPDGKIRGGHHFICSTCTVAKVGNIEELEKQLHTEFIDTDDMKEKLAYYNVRKEEAREQNTPNAEIRVKNLGVRLRAIRKKLGLNQEQFAQYTNLTRRSIISYEKSSRQIPENIKDWTKTSESIFKHLGREKGKQKIMKKFDKDTVMSSKIHPTAQNVQIPPRKCEQKWLLGTLLWVLMHSATLPL